MRTRFLVGCLLPALLVAATACTKADDGEGVASVEGSARPSPTPSLSLLEQMQKHAQCMRAHGVPMSDPQVQSDGTPRRGRIDKAAVSEEVLGVAKQACKQYEPVIPADVMAPKLEAMRGYSRCMRAHGVEDYPDPDPDGRVQLPREQTDPDYDQAKATCDAQQAAAADSASPNR